MSQIASDAITVYMIGGNSDADAATRRLMKEGFRVIVSVASPLGAYRAAAVEIDTGRKDAREIARRARGAAAAAIVDCSHPYAVEVSREAARAARELSLPYLRYTRPPVSWQARHVIMVDDWQGLVEEMKNRNCRSLLTIGPRQLHHFASAGLDLAVRILPLAESLNHCLELGIEPQDIIAAYPPHSIDFNRACIRHVGAELLVSKDSGIPGGLEHKAAAAAAEDIDLLVVARPQEPQAIFDLDQLSTKLYEALGA